MTNKETYANFRYRLIQLAGPLNSELRYDGSVDEKQASYVEAIRDALDEWASFCGRREAFTWGG